jgi:flagellar basal body-associated protein FliL
VGTALGALVVTTLLDLSWPLRIALIVVVLVVGLAYVLWHHRGEIAAAGAPGAAEDTPTDPVAN